MICHCNFMLGEDLTEQSNYERIKRHLKEMKLQKNRHVCEYNTEVKSDFSEKKN